MDFFPKILSFLLRWRSECLLLGILLQSTNEGLLLREGLEATVTELGAGIDELDVEGSGLALGRVESLPEGQDPLLGSDGTTLQHDPVLGDDTIVRETTDGGDALLSVIVLGGGVVLLASLTDTVDPLVHLGTVMVSVLTGTGDGVLDTARMPGTDTGNLAETLPGLTGKLGHSPTGGDTLETLTLGDTENINVLAEGKDIADLDFLLHEPLTELDLLGDGATVDLDLHNMGLLLAEVQLANLGVGNDTDDGAVLLDASKLAEEVLGLLGNVLLVLGESLLFGAVPVLVEATEDLVGKMVGPDGGQSTETGGGLDVTDHTDNNHSGSLNDGNSLAGLLVVPHLGPGHVDLTENVGHTSLVTHEGGEVAWLLLVIARESTNASADGLRALAGKKSQRPVAGSFKLSVRHVEEGEEEEKEEKKG